MLKITLFVVEYAIAVIACPVILIQIWAEEGWDAFCTEIKYIFKE
jgi:hypothetical protein